VTVDISEKMTDVQILQSTDHQYVDVLLSLRPTVFAANGELSALVVCPHQSFPLRMIVGAIGSKNT